MGVFLCFLLALLVSTCSAGGERCVRQDKQAAEFAGKAPWPRRSMGASSPSGGGAGNTAEGSAAGLPARYPFHHITGLPRVFYSGLRSFRYLGFVALLALYFCFSILEKVRIKANLQTFCDETSLFYLQTFSFYL
jgi:hypothetical protein